MKESEKTKPISKEHKEKLFTVSSVIGGRRFLRSQKDSYKINPKPIYSNSSRKSMVFQLQSASGKKYIGKIIAIAKGRQVISQIYFLNKLKGKEICNLVDFIKKPQGLWIISEKGHTSLYNYLDNLLPQEVQTILKNIALSYLTFYHKKIAHRDLKPSNIIVEKDLSIKFIDLELCTKVDQMYGTYSYIPPYIKNIRWDSSDSFAYGVIAKQMTQKCGLYDEKLEDLIRNCMNPNVFQKWGWKKIYQFWDIDIKTQALSQNQSQSQ